MKQQTRNHSDNGITYIDVPVRVRYGDTDRMGVVYYGTYPLYFEIGRSEYMRQLGLTYREVEEMGYALVVTELEAKYFNSATYDDLVVVRTGISDLKSRGVTFHYIICKDDTILVEGKTRHICLNGDKKPVTMPSILMDTLKNANP